MVIVYCKYLYKSNDIWRNFAITADEFFESNTEEIRVGSKPLYTNPLAYFKEKKGEISTISFLLDDREKMQQRVLTTFYWNNQKNYVTEIIDMDKDGRKQGFEIRTEANVEKSNKNIVTILRAEKKKGIYHIKDKVT